ncbi:MAG: 1-(5-phosphoribosyl)-5-[(5-phosphoribosylamino)methylideneamino]imidazole-4-carboxamide isomerase [Verrucomicrobiales bacterium]
MKIYPAIDLMNGQAVRLRQGKKEDKTVYSDDPVALAQQWEAQGGDWLHVVDLDGAFEGEPRHLDLIRQMVQALNIPVELGGGLRSEDAVENALAAGVSRVILGTKALQSLEFVETMVGRHGSERIAAGIDARDGLVAVHGWQDISSKPALSLALELQAVGVGALIYTDIATDGMMKGPNLDSLRTLTGQLKIDLIASGGISSKADALAVAEIEGVEGMIIGKALYENAIHLPDLVSSLTGH